MGPLELGESIAVSGVCLTVQTMSPAGSNATPAVKRFRSPPWDLPGGARSPRASAARGRSARWAHFSGHVDGKVRLQSRERLGEAERLVFEVSDRSLSRYVAQKGSVAIDGVSLTVNAVTTDTFDVAIIPHTLEVTTLGELRPGQVANFEDRRAGALRRPHLESVPQGAGHESRDENLRSSAQNRWLYVDPPFTRKRRVPFDFCGLWSRFSDLPMSPRLDIDPALLARVNGALDDIRAGKMVILVDDEDRENEGDLSMAAEKVTPEAINFMAMHGRGLICLTLDEEQVDRARAADDAAPGRSGPPLGTAFTVSIEARTGVTTGISAADRAHTIRSPIAPDAKPDDLVTPGPRLPAARARAAASSCAPARPRARSISRASPAAPGGRHLRDHERRRHDGAHADLERFAREARAHHRDASPTSSSTACRPSASCAASPSGRSASTSPAPSGTAVVYEIATEARQFFALVKGDVATAEPVSAACTRGSTIADLFSSTRVDGGHNLREAHRRDRDARVAAWCVYIPPTGRPRARARAHSDARRCAERRASSRAPLREFGLGAQVLADLGAAPDPACSPTTRRRSPASRASASVVERVPLLSMQG